MVGDRGADAATGRFSFDVAAGTWTWDPEVYRIHGLAPDSVRPTLEHVLTAAAGPDATRLEEAFARMAATAESFSLHYRLAAADGCTRSVVVVGERAVCNAQDLTLIEGYFIDLTATVGEVASEAADAAVEASAESRGVIEQAKGALMLAYGFDADAAFAMLMWWSRNRNIKVRDLAAELMQASEDGAATEQGFRARVDNLLYDLTDRSTGTLQESGAGDGSSVAT